MKRVLIVGDTILDHYVYGSVSRVNPEAPHSVVLDVNGKEEVKLGGACNVAANLRGIFGEDIAIHYFGVVSYNVACMLAAYRIAIEPELTVEDDQILLKTRYVCGNNHLLRVDRGQKYDLDFFKINLLKQKLREDVYDLVIISDYNKGTITAKTCEAVVRSGAKTLIDLKKRQNLFLINTRREDIPHLPKLTDVPTNSSHVILKCNTAEFEAEIGQNMIDVVQAVVKTRGADGCDVYYDDEPVHIPAPDIGSVADVVGAGDTFLAGMAAKFLETGTWDAVEMARFGTRCATEKVKHFGTHVVRLEDIHDKKEA